MIISHITVICQRCHRSHHVKIESYDEHGKIVYRLCSSCISRVPNSIEFSLSTQTWRVIKLSQAKSLYLTYYS